MRLVVVNANTSESVTEAVAAEARRVASPGTEIVPITGAFGARVITTRAENAVAGHALLDALAKHAGGADAVLIAVSYDTGLHAARELMPVPVVGMTEAALFTAAMLGGKFGLVTFGRRTLPLYRDAVEMHGLASRLAAIEALDGSALDVFKDRGAAEAAVAEAARILVRERGADTVVLSGAALAGMARTIGPSVPVPLVDGIAAGVAMAEMLVRLGFRKPTEGSYAAPTGRETVGLSPELAALLRRS
jgi:allantoin racemase